LNIRAFDYRAWWDGLACRAASCLDQLVALLADINLSAWNVVAIGDWLADRTAHAISLYEGKVDWAVVDGWAGH